MATARDHLVLDLLALAQKSDFQSMPDRIRTALERYRVQLKKGTDLTSKTARESLCQELLASMRYVRGPQLESAIKNTISRFRMQLKQSVPVTKSKHEEREIVPDLLPKIESKPSHSPQKSALLAEPLAGGPVRRTAARGQCPKCHSMGVVLAHSYAGDEYFSCIYCGFQAYRAAIEGELDLPLATELLGRSFSDKEETEEKEENDR